MFHSSGKRKCLHKVWGKQCQPAAKGTGTGKLGANRCIPSPVFLLLSGASANGTGATFSMLIYTFACAER